MSQSELNSNQPPPEEVSQVVEHLFRHEAGKMVATLTRIFGVEHLTLAEDVVQEALARALQTWPFYGVPKNPSAWIMRASRNLALDVVRRQKVFREKEAQIPFEIPAGAELARRLDGVLQSLYLLFNEGYKASSGDSLIREDLCREAVRLAGLLAEHAAGHQPRTHALLALMLLNAARLPA